MAGDRGQDQEADGGGFAQNDGDEGRPGLKVGEDGGPGGGGNGDVGGEHLVEVLVQPGALEPAQGKPEAREVVGAEGEYSAEDGPGERRGPRLVQHVHGK